MSLVAQQVFYVSYIYLKTILNFHLLFFYTFFKDLLLVAIDRYIAIFKPLTYKNMIRKWHVLFMVISIWTLSLCMSFIPIFFGWNNASELNNSSENYNISSDIFLNYTQNEGKLCVLEANVPFALISSSLSFYIPLIIMITVYFRIYIVAKRQAKSIAQIQFHSRNFKNQNQNNSNNVHTKNTDEILNDKEIKQILIQNGECRATDDKIDKTSRILKLIKSLRNIEKKRTRDTKAVKTVGIIMGKFLFVLFKKSINILIIFIVIRYIYYMLASLFYNVLCSTNY